MDYDEEYIDDNSSLEENDELLDEIDDKVISEETDNIDTYSGNSFSYNQNPYDNFNYNQNDVNNIKERINNRQIINNNVNRSNVVNSNTDNKNTLEKKDELMDKSELNDNSNNNESSGSDAKNAVAKKAVGKVAEGYGGKAAGAVAEKVMDSEVGKIMVDKATERIKKTLIFKVIGSVLSVFVPIILICMAVVTLICLPFAVLGIDLGGTTPSTDETYTESVGGKYLWPIGSNETTEKDGVTYALGKPASVTITSNYGRREDPITGAIKTHNGVDIGGVQAGKTNVIAANSGVVVKVVDSCKSYGDKSCGGGYGNHIMISHSDGKYTLYAHLHQNTITVQKNDKVDAGQVIAKTGSSGRSTGAHLHFEVRINSSTRTNPLNYISKSNPRYAV